MKRYLTIVAIQVSSVGVGAVLGYGWGWRLESGPFLEIIWPFLIAAGAGIGWLLGLILGGIYFWQAEHRGKGPRDRAMAKQADAVARALGEGGGVQAPAGQVTRGT